MCVAQVDDHFGRQRVMIEWDSSRNHSSAFWGWSLLYCNIIIMWFRLTF